LTWAPERIHLGRGDFRDTEKGRQIGELGRKRKKRNPTHWMGRAEFGPPATQYTITKSLVLEIKHDYNKRQKGEGISRVHRRSVYNFDLC